MAAFPTLIQLKNTFLLTYEGKIGQNSPLNDKAFLRLCSAVWAMIGTLLQKEVITASRENLAITASRAGLILIGQEYNLPIKAEVSAVLNVTLPATSGSGAQVPAGTNFTGVNNGILYFNTDIATESAGVIALQLTSRSPGAIGNLADAETLQISRQIAAVELIATVVSTETTGADAEETDVYRQRVLDIIRAPGGGGNSADFRNWAQEHSGVVRAFPYSGETHPLTGGSPPERVVYIEVQSSIQADGIPDAAFLAAVKLTIITDPVTGLHRQPLGITNDTLDTAPIRRTAIFVEITNALFLPGTEADVKSKIDTAMDNYFLSLQPFVTGLDINADRNDLITKGTISREIQDVMSANGASFETLRFDVLPASGVPSYQLGQGEKAKSGGVSYV